MLVLIRGAGDIASGIAMRLFHAGFNIVMTDIEHPTSIRRTVCFSQAVYDGYARVEDITAVLASGMSDIKRIMHDHCIPVIVDPNADICSQLKPDVVVDAILAKTNLGTNTELAPIVIGVGPGFSAGKDCHAVIETMRGHTLGRVILQGSAKKNTNIPGLIGGYTGERVLRAPCDGIFIALKSIGDTVKEGETVATVDGTSVTATISGTIRGLLPNGTPVTCGLKSGDIDPRDEKEYCFLVSDKALAVGGGVLEAIMRLRKE